jgi:hypothetical protein
MALAVKAVGTLTSSGAALNTETVTVGGKVYTFQTTLTDVDGNVLIGANAAASIVNLKAAINLGSGAGTLYAAAMALNENVRATSSDATTLVVKAKVPGTVGNTIASTETLTNFAWGAAVLASGTGSVYDDIRALVARSQMNAVVQQQILDMFDPEDDE